jgi:phosphatidylserine/phosphatidylglycerophosphate/cardiolipin synthase-like enzyme
MRVTNIDSGLKVHAIAGTYVVLLGFDLPQAQCDGLLGFSIHRSDPAENEAGYLKASKTFAETDPGFPPGSCYSTRYHPVQSFQWADYCAEPGHRYIYTITANKGTPAHLEPYAQTVVEITTECPATGDHDVYFNRGAAGSQAYVIRFGDRAPGAVPGRRAFEWLSRGLNEALEAYIRSCVPGVDALRIAAYEFNYDRFLDVVKAASQAGVDVQIVYHAKEDSIGIKNNAAVADKQLDAPGVSFRRTQPKSSISHNKFIVKLHNGQPASVWTGGTNFSEGGIYGHSNVAHVVEEPAIAQHYLDYWHELAQDLPISTLRSRVEALSPLPAGKPPAGATVLFSPRRSLDALNWYADLALGATDGLFMTFAFGMHDVFKNVYRNSPAYLRFALMEQMTRPMKAGPEKEAEEQKIRDLRTMVKNVFAIGAFIRTNKFDGWLRERLTGLNSNVRFIHNKFMLLDPLTDDPIVVAGSANFSDASTQKNDENMIIVRGDTRVADVYLGEFMRLYSHHAFRESLQWRASDDQPKYLRTDDWWKAYFGNTARSRRRKYFARLI